MLPFFLFLMVAAMGWIIPGFVCWALVIGSPLRFTYSKRIIFMLPVLLLSKSYYALYMRERNAELEADFERREAEEIRQEKGMIERWNQEK